MTVVLSDSSAVQPTELSLRLAGVLVITSSENLIPNTIIETERPSNSLISVPLIVNVMFLIVFVETGVITSNAALPSSYTIEG